MNKDQSRVQWTLPRWAADLIRETIELDSRSGAFDHALRQELSEALGEFDQTDLSRKIKPSSTHNRR
jgi:hypothetical protein